MSESSWCGFLVAIALVSAVGFWFGLTVLGPAIPLSDIKCECGGEK